jgi:hypothetical protein
MSAPVPPNLSRTYPAMGLLTVHPARLAGP